MTRIPKRRAYTLILLCSLSVWAVIGLAFARGCGAAEATLQSARPWSIGQCDRLTGRKASAVFNTPVWNLKGWPLWRVVCLY